MNDLRPTSAFGLHSLGAFTMHFELIFSFLARIITAQTPFSSLPILADLYALVYRTLQALYSLVHPVCQRPRELRTSIGPTAATKFEL
jgi:hypothetical protein